MVRQTIVAVLAASLAACTGRGIDRSNAVPIRASLAVRPVADGDPWVGTVAATAQGTLTAPAIEISSQTLSSRSSAPVVAHWMRGPKATLEELARRAGPAPAGLAVAYERERDDRWSLVVLRAHAGMVLDVTTLVTLAWAPEPADQAEPEGVYLLLSSDDGERFEQLTIEHDGRRLAIVDGDEVLMAPTVTEPIGGGQLLITPGADGSAGELYQRLSGQPAPPRP
jgi:preprotein translocase subunit SecD